MTLTPATKADFWEAKADIAANAAARSQGRLDLVDFTIYPTMTVTRLLIVRSERRALRAGWAKLPQEIKDKIIVFAMTSDEGEIRLHCLTPRDSRPNIALSLLRVNRQTHDIAIKALYEENTVVFTNYGSDLKLLHKAISLNTRLEIGIMNSGGPFFGHITLDLGERHFREIAWGKLTAFTGTLLKLPYGFFTVRNLTINLLRYTFARDDELYCFTEALGRIEVTQSFILTGSASHLELSVREFAVELRTNKQPKFVRFHPQNPRYDPFGYFENIYDVADPQGSQDVEDWDVRDATAFYDDWKEDMGLPPRGCAS
ncbi:hypothetical protein P7C71_g2087, partial [Lecanoromycetidae sp. Uapishka_2]